MVDRLDPWTVGRFNVEVDGVLIGGVRKAKIPGSSTEESGTNSNSWGQTRRGDLQMDLNMERWTQRLLNWNEEIQNDEDSAYKEIEVTLLNKDDGAAEWVWTFHDAWLKGFQPPLLGEVDEDGEGKQAIYSATFAYDSLDSEEA